MLIKSYLVVCEPSDLRTSDESVFKLISEGNKLMGLKVVDSGFCPKGLRFYEFGTVFIFDCCDIQCGINCAACIQLIRRSKLFLFL